MVKVIAQQLPFLPQDYQYRILFMDRDLREVLASQAKMLERNGLDPTELDDNVLARTFIRQVNQVKRLLEVHPNIDLLNVSYLGVLESPGEVASSVVEFVRTDLDQDQMQQRVKPALHRNVVDLSAAADTSVNASLND